SVPRESVIGYHPFRAHPVKLGMKARDLLVENEADVGLIVTADTECPPIREVTQHLAARPVPILQERPPAALELDSALEFVRPRRRPLAGTHVTQNRAGVGW